MASQLSHGVVSAPPGVVPNFVSPPNDDNQIIIVHTIFLIITTLSVVMRIYTQLQISSLRLGVSDCEWHQESKSNNIYQWITKQTSVLFLMWVNGTSWCPLRLLTRVLKAGVVAFSGVLFKCMFISSHYLPFAICYWSHSQLCHGDSAVTSGMSPSNGWKMP